MTKPGTVRILMIATMTLIVAFQVYWLHRLYHEEEKNFKRSVDLVFRETIYRLQAERFRNDTMLFGGMPGENLFMTDLVANIKEDEAGDSSGRKLMISLKRNETSAGERSSGSFKFKRDTVLYVNPDEADSLPPHIARFLEQNPGLNAAISTGRIDSLYRALLTRENIAVRHRIIAGTSAAPGIPPGFYATKKVAVGLIKPVFYRAIFEDPFWWISRRISIQLLLSALLLLLTGLSFIFIYRGLVAQRKLTQIKSEFINNMTHELKTPLATVNVAIEALRSFGGLNSPEKTREYLDISAEELQRLSMLVDKVLKMSMFENKEITLQKETFHLLQLVSLVLASMKLQFEKHQITASLESSGTNFMITADKLHITSVIYNLLDNALKYSKQQSPITVRVLDQANYLELRVEDNGIGIPAEYRQKIFEQFFRVPNGNQHNTKGYGLGLSYANHIVKRHLGFIEVESVPGKGSTFIVKLPFAEAPVITYDHNRRVYKIPFKL